MPALNLVNAEPATPTRTPHPGLLELAEGCLRHNPYLALKNVACDCRDGVLVLRGCRWRRGEKGKERKPGLVPLGRPG
jgi:hypothetical protein